MKVRRKAYLINRKWYDHKDFILKSQPGSLVTEPTASPQPPATVTGPTHRSGERWTVAAVASFPPVFRGEKPARQQRVSRRWRSGLFPPSRRCWDSPLPPGWLLASAPAAKHGGLRAGGRNEPVLRCFWRLLTAVGSML